MSLKSAFKVNQLEARLATGKSDQLKLREEMDAMRQKLVKVTLHLLDFQI